MDLEDALIEEEGKRGTSGKVAALAQAMVVVPASTKLKDGSPSKAATRYGWFYPNRVGRAPHTFVDVERRYLQKDDLHKERNRLLSEAKKESAGRRLELDVADGAPHLSVANRSQRTQSILKPKSAVIRDKRLKKAEEELLLARSKAVDIDVTL